MNVSKIYWLLGFIHVLCYVYFREKVKAIDEDLLEFSGGRCGVRAFMSVLPQREYRYVFYYRLPFFIRHLLNFILPRTTTCYLHTAEVLGGVRIVHGYSSIIVAKSIGHHFSFFQNVTVGWGKDGIPTIGNHVTLFPGSVISGNIIIGNNVRVAANTVVRTDVPDNSLVYGNPAIIVQEKK